MPTSIEHQQIEYARASCELDIDTAHQTATISDGDETIALLDDWRYGEWEDRVADLLVGRPDLVGDDAEYLIIYRHYLDH